MKSKYFRSLFVVFKGFLGFLAYGSIWPTSLVPFLEPNILIDTVCPQKMSEEILQKSLEM